MCQEKNSLQIKDRWKGEPYLQAHQIEKVARKFMQIVGRDFDTEFEEWKNEQLLLHVKDGIITEDL